MASSGSSSGTRTTTSPGGRADRRKSATWTGASARLPDPGSPACSTPRAMNVPACCIEGSLAPGLAATPATAPAPTAPGLVPRPSTAATSRDPLRDARPARGAARRRQRARRPAVAQESRPAGLPRPVAILECLSTQRLARGDVVGAEDAARRAEQLDEHSDVAVRTRLRALALTGDRGQALAAFTAFAGRLKRDLGAEPDAETRALADRIRQGRGWRLPETVRAAPTGPESRRAPLVGRSGELERLVTTWAACRDGRIGVAIVEGDGGTGKTRLAEELAARARLDGAVIAAVRAVEGDGSDPWSGVLGIARAGLLDAPGIAAASPASLAGLRGSAPLDAPARAFSEALRVVADEQPVMVVVDDAHWLDRESLLALGAAARDLTRSRVLLLFTAVPHRRRAELDQIRAHLR